MSSKYRVIKSAGKSYPIFGYCSIGRNILIHKNEMARKNTHIYINNIEMYIYISILHICVRTYICACIYTYICMCMPVVLYSQLG